MDTGMAAQMVGRPRDAGHGLEGACAGRGGPKRNSGPRVGWERNGSSAGERPRRARAADRAPLRADVSRLIDGAWPLLQGTAAATVAWVIAVYVFDHHEPFFAPVAAVIALNTSLGERGLNTMRLLQGVVVGIVVGSVALAALGSGTGSLALATFVAMAIAFAARGARIVVAQAAVGAILTVAIGEGEAGVERLADALIGAGVALVFSQVLFSPEPVGSYGVRRRRPSLTWRRRWRAPPRRSSATTRSWQTARCQARARCAIGWPTLRARGTPARASRAAPRSGGLRWRRWCGKRERRPSRRGGRQLHRPDARRDRLERARTRPGGAEHARAERRAGRARAGARRPREAAVRGESALDVVRGLPHIEPDRPVDAGVVEEVVEVPLARAVRRLVDSAGRDRLPGQPVVDDNGDAVLGPDFEGVRHICLERRVAALVLDHLDIVDPRDGAVGWRRRSAGRSAPRSALERGPASGARRRPHGRAPRRRGTGR